MRRAHLAVRVGDAAIAGRPLGRQDMKHLILMSGAAAMLALSSAAAFAMPAWQTQGQRATEALNMLEANGDGQFNDFRAIGRDFAANVEKNGTTQHVVIRPGANTIEPTLTGTPS
jgi:hypothetical protein